MAGTFFQSLLLFVRPVLSEKVDQMLSITLLLVGHQSGERTKLMYDQMTCQQRKWKAIEQITYRPRLSCSFPYTMH
jgi:hypothetical protein